MTVYAIADDVKNLIGNLSGQRTTLAIDNAIAGASEEVNITLGRDGNDNLDVSSQLFSLCQKATRYLAASELLGGVQSQETTMQFYQDTAEKLLAKIIQDAQEADISPNFVESSEAVTWPANPSGVIYSNNFVGLRKAPRTTYNVYLHDFIPL